MKNSTKFKIIKWVEKTLKYHEPINPPLSYKERRLEVIYAEVVDTNSLPKEIFEKETNKKLLEYLSGNGFIGYQQIPSSEVGKIRYQAILMCCKE